MVLAGNAGMAVARQRQSTAKGIVFMLLEDEYGQPNLIVPPQVYEDHRAIVRGEPLILARGRFERVVVQARRRRGCGAFGFGRGLAGDGQCRITITGAFPQPHATGQHRRPVGRGSVGGQRGQAIGRYRVRWPGTDKRYPAPGGVRRDYEAFGGTAQVLLPLQSFFPPWP